MMRPPLLGRSGRPHLPCVVRVSHFTPSSDQKTNSRGREVADSRLKEYIKHIFPPEIVVEAHGFADGVEESADPADGATVKPMGAIADVVHVGEVEQTPHVTHELSESEELRRTLAYLERKTAELRVLQEEVSGLLDAATKGLSQRFPSEQLQHIGHLRARIKRGSFDTGSNSHRAVDAEGADASKSGTAAPGDPGVHADESILPQDDENEVSRCCVVQHPGALCCTTTSLAEDSETKVTVLTLRTLARCSGGVNGFRPADLSVLASQALISSAQEFCRERSMELEVNIHSEERIRLHAAIRRILDHGTIVSAERNSPSQFGHESYMVTLQDPSSSRQIQALFKPRVLVAYELNLMLGMDAVPPVGYRTGGVDVDYQHYEEGAFIYFSQGCRSLKTYPSDEWHANKEVLLSSTRILDVLLHNSDRHHGHFLLGQHWVEGVRDASGHWCGAQRPILIDHAASFRKEAVVTMEHENAFLTGPVRQVSSRTYLRLRFLDAASITARFAKFLSEKEMRQMLHRRTQILHYLDNLVQQQGYAETVIEEPALGVPEMGLATCG